MLSNLKTKQMMITMLSDVKFLNVNAELHIALSYMGIQRKKEPRKWLSSRQNTSPLKPSYLNSMPRTQVKRDSGRHLQSQCNVKTWRQENLLN